MARLIDISPRVSPEMAVFPGDRVFEREVAMSFAKGDHLELSAIRTTLHMGAHADAPSHYGKNVPDISARRLNPYIGPAQVIRISGMRPHQRIEIQHIDSEVRAPRVLFATDSFPNPNQWQNDFNAFSPELLEWLAEKRVILVGIDTPSVDLADDKELVSHQVLLRRDICVLEGLELKQVEPGEYILIALPLKLKDCEASPVRAVLLQDFGSWPELEE